MAPPRLAVPERRAATVAPLSSAQERLWFLHQSAPESPVYNVPLITRWREPADVPALTRALTAVVACHEILRTTYELHDGRPVQVVQPPAPVALTVVPAEAPEPHELIRHARAPFSLQDDPPLRATLWQDLHGGPATLLLNIHHIAVDGWSLSPLYEALSAAYGAALATPTEPTVLPEPPVQYADFAAWEAEGRDGSELELRLAARIARLAPTAGQAVTLGPVPARERLLEGDRRGARVRFTLDAELVAAAATLARELRATPFVVLFGAFQAVVQRWSGRESFLLGTVAANRPHPAVDRSIGFFVNTVPLLCAPDPEASFAELCAASRAEAFGILRHQGIPFERLAARLGAEGLADIGFVLQNATAAGPQDRWAPPELLDTGTAKQDLSLVLEYAADGSLDATVEYDADRYTESVASALAQGFTTLLEAAVAKPGTLLKDLPIAPARPGEHPDGVLVGEAPAPFPAQTVAAALERALSEGDPAATVVEAAGSCLTRGELASWSGAVAARLRADGVGPGSLVPVLAARGPALVAAWVGVLRAGAAFVPLAMDAPPARIAYILEQTAAERVLVCSDGAALLAELTADLTAEVATDLATDLTVRPGATATPAAQSIEQWREAPAPSLADTPAPAVGREDPAAVIYTSGTTGRPKGVVVPQRGLLATALWWGRDCALGPADRLLVTAGTAFDPAAFNVVEALLAGAVLVLADDEERRDPRALLGLVRGPRGATVAGSVTPTLLHALLEADAGTDAGSGDVTLHTLYCGGEALPRRLAAECAARWGVRIVNVYGPTEASCNSTHATVDPADEAAPPIGVPLPGTRAYVLGPRGEELPPGVPGELYVAGTGVATGYLAAPEQTAGVFLPDRYAARFGAGPDALMYRTGDRVVVRADGQLGYLGRADDQLKILGNRIEPAEVTRVIEEHPAVVAAAVHATGTPPTLVGYVELDAAGTQSPPTREELLRPLARWLPAAALPSAVYAVPGLPRTVNDKVDFAALARLRSQPLASDSGTGTADLTPSQRRAAALIADALAGGPGAPAADELGTASDFFTLGGHSLLAVKVVAEAGRRHGTTVPLRVFLADPTVAGLARALDAAAQADAAPAAQAAQAGRATDAADATGDGRAVGAARPFDAAAEYPVDSVQQRLWALDRIRDLRTAYLAPAVVEIDGPVDREALREAFEAALGRHPALRSRFRLDVRSRRVLCRTDGPAPEVVLTDGSGWSAQRYEEELVRLCWTPFDLAREAPARGAVIALAPGRTALVYGVHHIVSDGWSVDLVLRDTVALYRASTTGVPAVLPAPGHPGSTAAQRPQNQGDVDAVLAGLRGAPTDIALPHDRPRPTTQRTEAEQRTVHLPRAVAERLQAQAARRRCTPFMMGVALLAAVLARRGSQRDFLFAFPWADRDGADRTDLVGMFVNTLLIRADLRAHPTWSQLLEQVRDAALTGYRHAEAPFDALAAALHPGRDLSRPAVTPVYVNAVAEPPTPPLLAPDTRSRFVTPPRLRAKYELELTVTGGPGRFDLSLTYLTALFDTATVEALLADLARAATDLADPTDLWETPVLSTDPQPTAADLAEQVAAAWTEVLDGAAVDDDVNFFDAGGDSLLLIVLMERLSELTGRELEAADLFEHSTIDAQVAFLSGAEGSSA